MIERFANALRTMVVRAKAQRSIVGPRTLLQVEGLEGQVTNVELLLPPGYSARPRAGADLLLLPVLGSHDHLVAIGGDSTNADAIPDLADGEFGFRSGAYQVVFRTDHLEVTGQNVTFRAATSGTAPVNLKITLPTTPGDPETLWVDGTNTVRQA